MTSSSSRPAFKRLLPLAGLILAGLIGAAYMLGSKSVSKPNAPEAVLDRPVQVRKVVLAPVKPPKLLVGTVRARVEIDQGFRVSGKIAERKVQAGDRIKAGAVLATLDATDFRLQRESAEAELAAAFASEKQAQAELQRVVDLRKQGWSTEQILDRQRATLEEASGRRKRAERQVEISRNAQSYAVLVAEADGIITGVNAEAGQVVAAGQAMFRIARDGEREAQVAIPEHYLEEARTGSAQASLWSSPGALHPARLRELSPNADAATRTFAARFSLPDLPADAPLGMSVTLHLNARDAQDVVRVPLSALLDEGAGTEVYVVDPATNQLKRQPVRVMAYEAREALVGSGLNDNDLVVTLGVHKLRAGQKVRTLSEAKSG